jgi:hypothetical protein
VSDSYLFLVPTDPFFAPSAEVAERARALLERLVPDAHEVNAEVTDAVEFIHGFENWVETRCPNCGTTLDEKWVIDEITAAVERRGESLEVVTPCCRVMTSLNDLEYQGPAGFARFLLEAMNPQVADYEPAWVAEIAEASGTPLRTIWAYV